MRSHPKEGKVVRLEVDSWSDYSYVLNVKALVGDFETSNFAKVRFQHSLLTTEHLPRWQLSDYSVAAGGGGVVEEWRHQEKVEK